MDNNNNINNNVLVMNYCIWNARTNELT